MRYEVKAFKKISYIIRYPNGYAEKKKYPVILFLHGAGSRGNNIAKLKENPYFNITDKFENFPVITFAPQCNEDTWFDLFELLKEFVYEICISDFSDLRKIYAVGASMGAYAVWQLAMSLPDVFSAIVPICGGGMYWNARRLANMNVWAFHGKKDKVVYSEESVKMVESINQVGGNAKLTVYRDNEHDSWSDTYSNYEVFEWLLSCENKKITMDKKRVLDDPKIYG